MSQFTKLSPREQQLLSILGVVAAAIFLLGVPAYVYSSLWDARGHNQAIRDEMARMGKASELLAKRRSTREAQDMRYARPAPALASFIESAARDNGLEVPESKDRPEVKGKGYTERITVVKMRKVGLKPLVKTLEKIERSGHPVAITRLNIKTRTGGPDIYDVELGVSAYDKKGAKASGDDKDKDGKKAPAKAGDKPKKGTKL